MNAYELADLIGLCGDGGYNQDAANMLRQFGLAESIIKQQALQIEALKEEMAEWKMSYENCHRMCNGYGMN